MKLTAVIVDDEKPSREALCLLLNRYCPEVEVKAQGQNVSEGIALIDHFKPDVVFLDVEMPVVNGFRLLDHYRDNVSFHVIFTTAFNHYAVKAFKYSAIDYLLKPISLDDLQQAIQKISGKKEVPSRHHRVDALLQNVATPAQDFGKLVLPTKDGYSFTRLQDIVRFEADGNYTKVFLVGGEMVLMTKTLKEFEDILPYFFFRIHKSHLINLNFVKKYIRYQANTVVLEDGTEIDVAVRKKEEFLERMNILN